MQQCVSIQNHLDLLRVRRIGRREQRVCSVRPHYVLVDCILHIISEKSFSVFTTIEHSDECRETCRTERRSSSSRIGVDAATEALEETKASQPLSYNALVLKASLCTFTCADDILKSTYFQVRRSIRWKRKFFISICLIV